MTTPTRYVNQNLTQLIIRAFYDVYNELGCGFVESVYEAALALALRQAGLGPQRQAQVAVWFRGHQVGAFRADLVVNDAVVVEIKAGRRLEGGARSAAFVWDPHHEPARSAEYGDNYLPQIYAETTQTIMTSTLASTLLQRIPISTQPYQHLFFLGRSLRTRGTYEDSSARSAQRLSSDTGTARSRSRHPEYRGAYGNKERVSVLTRPSPSTTTTNCAPVPRPTRSRTG